MTIQAIFVTGASTGIGRAIAVHFAKAGWRVYAGVRREADARELQHQHDGILPINLDVTRAEQITEAGALVAEHEGTSGLRVLVNNAGVAVPAPVELLPLEELRRQFEINVFGVVAVTQACLSLLRRYGHGATVVNISSTSARMVSPLTGAYSASKMALEAFNNALRFELRPWGIRACNQHDPRQNAQGQREPFSLEVDHGAANEIIPELAHEEGRSWIKGQEIKASLTLREGEKDEDDDTPDEEE